METQIINGVQLANSIQEKLINHIKELQRPPKLAVILVGENPASVLYVSNKQKIAEKLGVTSTVHRLSAEITEDHLIGYINELNNDESIDGILVQLPLPKGINEHTIISAISPEKDIDGLHIENLGNLFVNEPALKPCTPLACMALIQSVCPNLEGKVAIVIGRSRLVGKPIAQMLLNSDCTVIHAHSKSNNLQELCRLADIIVTATGKPNLIREAHIKTGAIIIDVGITKLENKKIVGDVAFDEAITKASAITPVPGGVGPMTITMLFVNLLNACKKNLQKS